MAIQWRLKSFLSSQRGIYKAVELQKRVVKKTGILISLQNLCNYMNKKPVIIRLTTLELLCTALDCELSDFCKLTPNQDLCREAGQEAKKLSAKNTPFTKRAVKNFPEPKDYK